MSFSFIGCSHKERLVQKIYNVKKVKKSLSYNENDASNFFLFQGENYFVISIAGYNQLGQINQLKVNKPEGMIEYSMEEVLQDTLLTSYYSIPRQHFWRISEEGHLIVHDKKVELVKARDEVYFVKLDNKLYFIEVD